MRAVFSVLTWLLLAAPSVRPTGTLALVYDASIDAHLELAETIEGATALRVVARDPAQPWTESAPPDGVITIGDAATAWIKWAPENVPHAALLRWVPPEKGLAQRPRLHASVHTDPECTEQILRRRLEGSENAPHRLIIWAESDDAGARELATSLDAQLATGDVRALSTSLSRAGMARSSMVFVRPGPSHLRGDGLARLATLARAQAVEAGTDLQDSGRLGLATWVTPDLEAHAVTVERWMRRALRRPGRRRTASRATRMELPCRP